MWSHGEDKGPAWPALLIYILKVTVWQDIDLLVSSRVQLFSFLSTFLGRSTPAQEINTRTTGVG